MRGPAPTPVPIDRRWRRTRLVAVSVWAACLAAAPPAVALAAPPSSATSPDQGSAATPKVKPASGQTKPASPQTKPASPQTKPASPAATPASPAHKSVPSKAAASKGKPAPAATPASSAHKSVPSKAAASRGKPAPAADKDASSVRAEPKREATPASRRLADLPAPDPAPLPGVHDPVGVDSAAPIRAPRADAASGAKRGVDEHATQRDAARPLRDTAKVDDGPSPTANDAAAAIHPTQAAATTRRGRGHGETTHPQTSEAHAAYDLDRVVTSATPPASADESITWVQHTVIPGERLLSIAARYDTTAPAIASANGLPERPALRVGDVLWVPATSIPPERAQILHQVEAGEDWHTIGAKHRVHVAHLRRWNLDKPAALVPGTTLRVFTERAPDQSHRADPSALGFIDALPIPNGGESVGLPHKGSLSHGVAMPEHSEVWILRRPDEAFGSSHALYWLQRTLLSFKHASGYERPLFIGAISRKAGGKLRPHASHQSGRDVDIRLPVIRSAAREDRPTVEQVDWAATWILVREALATGQVEFIFLDHARQAALYRAALDAGATPEQLEAWLQYPRAAREGRTPIRHSPGHEHHIHIRFRCGTKEARCSS